ncbi:protein-disulfide reductase DsbD [Massilia sp. TW-1]|uniref:Thiol:disulfide interchange protein DsbD n=1 Tax=Telluria antibiotica TaxID=2717319 RepID=A0ABX0P870_9BURK|nr:protein-disulfide reductase DsbD [Telluria antibiotica]NIA53145.1 protein-disulfide reductase DsbD [Telluria antibiotica]
MKQLFRWMAALVLLASALGRPAVAADDFLPPEQAFKLSAELRPGGTVHLAWAIAPGYHLYRDRLVFTGPEVGQPALPDGVRKFDSNFNKEMETYAGQLAADLPVKTDATTPFVLRVGYQGCADAGLCYPPAEVAFTVDPAAPGALKPAAPDAAPVAAAPAPASAPAPAHEDDSSLAQRTLQSGSAWRIGLAFLAFGLLLSFTPCVLPMVPILSSIIVGEGNASRGKGFTLALAYSLGMALVYTSLGVAAGLAGEGLAGALQKPWVLLTFGALLVVLALSMFDVYQLQLPSSLQSRLSTTSGRMSGGRFAGVFVMGALSALIVGPCVAGPLAGALLYISQTRNVWTGGWALFSMAAGMSVPLLLTGVSAGSLLPRAGAWMNHVKRVFGLLLLAVAIWMVTPVFPVTIAMLLWGAFAVLCAVFLRVFEPVAAGAGLGRYAGKTLGLVLLTAGLFELVGAASAGHDVLQPLAHLRGGPLASANAQEGKPQRFERIRTVADLERVLASTTTPVMLDFYADWCVSCKEMERFTFSEPQVEARMKQVRLLQVDVTANGDDDRALMKKFGLFGPPGIILFKQGKEVPQSRVIGFMAPEQFAQHLSRHFAS